MAANARWGDREQGFLDAETLARQVVRRKQDPIGAEGGTVVVDR
jgi:hypothetical protein